MILEQQILGASLSDNELAQEVVNKLSEDNFIEKINKQLFKDLKEMHRQEKEIDLVTVSEFSDVPNEYLVNIMETEILIKSNHINVLKEQTKKRDLVKTMSELTLTGSKMDYNELLLTINTKLLPKLNRDSKGTLSMSDMIFEANEDLERRQKGETGIQTGFSDLDRKIIGFEPKNLYMIAARPSMGKTALMLNIIRNIDRRTLLFSLEMNSSTIIQRLQAATKGIDSSKIRSGNLQDEDWEKIIQASEQLSRKDLIIDDKSYSINEIEDNIRKHEPEIVFIDHIGLIDGESNKKRNYELQDISRRLYKISAQLEIPIVCLSQLNRGVEQRQNHRPMLSDLRDSGALEQDFAVVMFLYRDSYYYPDTDSVIEKDGEKVADLVEISVAKQRHGSTGVVELAWEERYQRFSSIYFEDNEKSPFQNE